jgi:flagellar biosynthesis protein FlhG
MTDQAQKLRSLVQCAGPAADAAAGALPLVVVTGSRAGVGATTVALNLAAVLADRAERVLLIDGSQHGGAATDIGGPRMDVEYSLADVMAGKCGIEDALVEGPMGLAMVLARGRVSPRRGIESRRDSTTGGDFSRRAQELLLNDLQSLDGRFDLVVIDAGRGLTPWSRRFWLRARLNVLVTTADDAAVLDAYAALKEIAAEAVGLPVRLLMNRADCDAEAVNAHRRLENACQRFLSKSIPALPALPRNLASELVGASMPPRVWEMPDTPFGHAALWLGRAVSELVGMEDSGRGIESLRYSATPEACIPHRD